MEKEEIFQFDKEIHTLVGGLSLFCLSYLYRKSSAVNYVAMVKYYRLSLISSIQWKKKWPKSMRRTRGKKRRRQRGDDHEIPFDLIIEILIKLPAKSLMRFKCVSKLWSCLIPSRYFSNLYLTAASPPRPPLRVYMSLVEHYKYNFSNFYHCQYPRKRQLLSLRLSPPHNSAESSLKPDMTFPGMGGHEMVVLRGLILYSVCRKAFIYNPATRQSLTLPAIKSNIFAQKGPKYGHYFFGHDPIHDQYKIVCTVVLYPEDHEKITSEYWVFVLEPGSFWKRIEYDDQPHLPTRQGLCINGVIYYLASTDTCDNVYSFDVRSEDFNKIQAPSAVSGESVGFMEHGGKPALLDYTHIRETGVSELWVLEIGLGGKWSKTSLVLKPCQRHLVDDINIMDLRVHGTGQNNEVILALTCPCYLLYYDLIKNDLRKVNINREMPPNQLSYVYVKIMDKSESIMHLQL